MSEHRCEAHIFFRGGDYPCGKKAKYYEAKYSHQPDKKQHFCGTHAPSQIELRRQNKKDREQAKHDKLHADPEFLKSQISLCKARIEAHQTELADLEAKLETTT